MTQSSIDSKALEIIDFYDQLGWEHLMLADKTYLVNSKLEGLPYEIVNLVSIFNNGAVAVGAVRIPVSYYNYLRSKGIDYIEVECLKK